MEHAFWHDRWDTGRTGFHQATPHPWLDAHWAAVGIDPEAQVFVPLCGKSVDMVWLRERGHRIVGVELSERAVADFFVEQGIDATRRNEGPFTVLSGGGYELWAGDFFAFPEAAVATVGAVYDRASLIALPPPMRADYGALLTAMTPAAAPMVVITIDYPQSEMNGPPFSVPHAELAELYGAAFTLDLIERKDIFTTDKLAERGLSRLDESLHVLRRN